MPHQLQKVIEYRDEKNLSVYFIFSSPHCFLIVAKQSLLIVDKQSSEKPFTSNPEKDIICSGDVSMDISKEKPLMGFERTEYVPTDSTMPIATNVSFF